jgi:3-oxoacyl-[acyl-carrier protein] reductase
MQSLKGKTAFITGAGKGLGKAMALALAAEGVHLGLMTRSAADLEQLSQEISQMDRSLQVASEAVDVSNVTAVQNAIESLHQQLGKVDILICNAGILKMGSFLETSIADWERIIQTNVLGTFYTIHASLPHLLKQSQGDIITIASTAGLKGSANLSAYGASKAAVINMTESLMQE